MLKPLALLAIAASLVSASPVPRDEPVISYNAITLIECGDMRGTAWWYERDRIATAYHVSGERECSINGVRLTRIHADAANDIAVYSGLPNRNTIRVNCARPRQNAVLHGVGYAFGRLRHTVRYIYTGARDDGRYGEIGRGMYIFTGESFPGQSGGPALDRQGRAQTIINRGTRSPPLLTQGRALADTFICAGRR